MDRISVNLLTVIDDVLIGLLAHTDPMIRHLARRELERREGVR